MTLLLSVLSLREPVEPLESLRCLGPYHPAMVGMVVVVEMYIHEQLFA